VPLSKLFMTPLRNNRYGWLRALPTAVLLAVFRLLPRDAGIAMARCLLNCSELPGGRLWRKSRS